MLFRSAIAGFFAGKIADRASLRLLMGGGIAVCGVSIALMGFVTQPWHAYLSFGVIYALANGAASIVPVAVMVTRAAPDRAGVANGVVTAGMSVGQLVIVAALSGVLVLVGWRNVFFWLGAIHALFFIVIVPMIPGASAHGKSEAAATPRTGMTLREAVRTQHFWLLSAIFAI